MKKNKLILNIMEELNIKNWIMYSDEGSDEIFQKFITDKTIVPACCIIIEGNIYLIVHELDFDNVKNLDFNVICYNYDKGIFSKIEEVLCKIHNCPEEIYMSFTTKNDAQVDILGHGIYNYLTNNIRLIYNRYNKKVNFNSSEEIIYSLFDRKTNLTIKRMKMAANRTIDILEETFRNLKENMTEIDIVNLTHEIFNSMNKHQKIEDVIDVEYAWKEEMCPVVLVGPSLEKGGHAIASEQLLHKGYTIYFDFGISLIFKDGEKVSSDLQRMGYFLKNSEKDAPQNVKKVFDTLIKSIDLGISKIKPNIKGYEVDSVVRNYIRDKGYPDYNHSTGHSIGEEAHNPGTLLGTRENKLANLAVQKFGVYTIEPRISIPNGGSIEEMIYVTPNGGVPISNRQKKLYLISV